LLLSHAGYFVDQQIAKALPELDIIIGAHTHTRIPHPTKHNRTIICQAGEKSKYLGVLDLKVDVDNDSVFSFLGKLVPIIVDYIQPDTLVARIVDSIDTECLKGFNEIIGELKSDWVRKYGQESNIGNWITDIILDFSQADVAFYNSGGIRKNLNAGPISIKDVWEITPFENSVVYFYVRGDSLYNLFEFQVSDSAQKLQVAGAEYKYNLNNPQGKRIVDLKINKQEIIPSKIYKVATNSFVALQSKNHFGFDLEPTQIFDCEIHVRDIFTSYVKKQKLIDSKIENRIVQVY
jgi:5'-nucleotidase